MNSKLHSSNFYRGASKGNKYGAKPSWRCLECGSLLVADLICRSCKSENVRRFDSRAEARRFDELRMMTKAGEVTEVECQRRYPIHINDVLIGHYVADFDYIDKTGDHVTEDVKGGTATDTAMSKFKRRCFAAIYGREVVVVRR